jgi:alpha-beta hydrolase superfamily lysophospholipase
MVISLYRAFGIFLAAANFSLAFSIDSARSFTGELENFNYYRAAKSQMIGARIAQLSSRRALAFDPRALEVRLPYILHHEAPTEFRALMIHGLGDSPYFMKDLGHSVFRTGINVQSILLSGHGTLPSDLKNVSYSQWQSDLRMGVHQSRFLGPRLILVGYSTGGALALDYALENPDEVAALVLIAPAIRLFRWSGRELSCRGIVPAVPMKIPSPAKYKWVPSNAICELNRLTQKNANTKTKLEVPVLLIVTDADTTVDSESARLWLKKIPSSYKKGIQITKKGGPSSAEWSTIRTPRPVSHSVLPLKSNEFDNRAVNPVYLELEKHLSKFLRTVYDDELGSPRICADQNRQ